MVAPNVSTAWTSHPFCMEVFVRFPLTLTIDALIASGTGCASSGSSSAAGSVASKSGPDLLSSTDIESMSGAPTAYDVVLQLRPRWLQVRSSGSITQGGIMAQSILVYLDGNRIGTVDALKSVTARGIKRMQFLDAAKAANTLRQVGSEPIAGAIVITTQ